MFRIDVRQTSHTLCTYYGSTAELRSRFRSRLRLRDLVKTQSSLHSIFRVLRLQQPSDHPQPHLHRRVVLPFPLYRPALRYGQVPLSMMWKAPRLRSDPSPMRSGWLSPRGTGGGLHGTMGLEPREWAGFSLEQGLETAASFQCSPFLLASQAGAKGITMVRGAPHSLLAIPRPLHRIRSPSPSIYCGLLSRPCNRPHRDTLYKYRVIDGPANATRGWPWTYEQQATASEAHPSRGHPR